MDLAKTVERLDILASKNSNLYPPQIRQWAGMVLEEGNKAGETLIDIHKKYYASLKECFSLKEVKEKFPEFENVISSNDVDFSKNSLLDIVQQGKLECFDKDEDLSLQLLKLYWGEGFSLKDLQKYTITPEKLEGYNLYRTLQKLNIPLVDRDYGHTLKLSDAQYNSRIIEEMRFKKLANADKKAQLADGEPVYIPQKRGPLSPEHKEHISKGLLKHYQQHPEAITAMSERQKQFYRDNPEKAETVSRVSKKAWNIFNADKIKSALSSFMKQNGIKDFTAKDLEHPFNMSKEKSIIMKKFWGINEWAKKSFSKNMEFAWKKVKEENDMSFTWEVMPSRYKENLENWMKEKGYNPKELKLTMTYYPHKPELNDINSGFTNIYTREFCDSNGGIESKKISDAHLQAISDTYKTLRNDKSNNTEQLDFLKEFISIYERQMHTHSGIFNGRSGVNFSSRDVMSFYNEITLHCMNNHKRKYFDILLENVDKHYNVLDNCHKAGKPFPELNLF